MQTLVLMRYSYFGQSGWRSGDSRDIDKLLDPERLQHRAALLEQIALPSLAAQTDPDFKLVVLSSQAMPQAQQNQLTQLCKDMLGADRAHVIFREPAPAGAMFRRFTRKHLNADPVTTQVVLDDDDALATDFMEQLKPEAELAYKMRGEHKPYTFLSFPYGLSLSLQGDEPELYRRSIPFTNLGLSLVGRTGMRKTVYGIAHKKVHLRNPARLIYNQQPLYIRTVHNANDSNAVLGTHKITPEEMGPILERFPCLQAMFPQHAPIADVVRLAA